MVLRGSIEGLLPALDSAFPTAILPELTKVLSESTGSRSVSLWLADYEQAVLTQLAGHGGVQVGDRVRVGDGGGVSVAYAHQRPHQESTDGGFASVCVPITLRGERVGVLQAEVPSPVSSEVQQGLSDAALTLAYVLTLAPRFTDVFEQARRHQPLSVPAEMQWSLLAARSFSTEQFSLAGRLLPPYDVGGDVYDFAVDPDTLWIAVIDAMGHGAQASVLAALAAHSLRNARRRGLDLPGQVAAADAALKEVFGGDRFVTGVLLHVGFDEGLLTVTNAGHPPPYLVRHGEVQQVAVDPQLPMGLARTDAPSADGYQLEPGDRLVVVSDGVLEGALATGDDYGDRHLQEQLVQTCRLEAREAVDALQEHLSRHVGERLRDDATIAILDWHGTAAAG
jgi:serine phosphatase RsbU (regulator of sigma subunit)